MLAGLDDSKPIIDKFVKQYFNLELKGNGDFKTRLANALEQYSELEERYREFLKGYKANSIISFFDKTFPNHAAFVSPVKKIDFLIYWKGKFGINENMEFRA